MMVGYDKNHDGDVYCMWNLVTEWVLVAWDIVWLKQMMFQKWVEEEEAQMLPDIEAEIVEWRNQEVAAPEEEPEAECWMHR